MPGKERGPAPFRKVAAEIESRIRGGEYAVGTAIPSVRQIMAMWDMALGTATKVHAELRQRGLVETVPGVGSIVRSQKADLGGQGLARQSRHTGKVYQGDHKARIVSVELIPAPERVASAMGLPVGAEVVKRDRVVLDGCVALTASTSWLPGTLVAQAPALLKKARVKEGTFAYVAAHTGRMVARGREEVCAGAATEEVAAALGVDVGVPVLLAHTWFFDADGELVEYGESARRPGVWSAQDFEAH